jgi:hypothetical protein
MNHIHLQNAKRYLQETHEQARRDALARSLQPSLREHFAKTLLNLAKRLTPSQPQQESWL